MIFLNHWQKWFSFFHVKGRFGHIFFISIAVRYRRVGQLVAYKNDFLMRVVKNSHRADEMTLEFEMSKAGSNLDPFAWKATVQPLDYNSLPITKHLNI